MIFSTFCLSLVSVFTLAVNAQTFSASYTTDDGAKISSTFAEGSTLNINITFPVPELAPKGWFLHLVQVLSEDGTDSNTLAILEKDLTNLAKCISRDCTGSLDSEMSSAWEITVPIEFEEQGIDSLSNVFFCIGDEASCEADTYSSPFNIVASGVNTVPAASNAPLTPPATGALSLSATTSSPLTLVPASASTAAESGSIRLTLVTATITSPSTTLTSTYFTTTDTSSSMTTTTAAPSTTTSSASSTASTTSAPTESSTSTPAKSSKGLSAGAKAGIAVGVILLVLILLLIAFLLVRRRRQKQRMQPEQMMLAQGHHSREGSRDLVAEKGETVGAGTIETTRGGMGAASEDTAYEEGRQRQQTPERDHDEHEHEQSRAPLSSPETMSPATTGERFDEPYRDAPTAVYGDARHSPQIFRGSQHFLGEEGLSAEDIERLEEEERRIDAAIAESEARR